MLGPLRCQRVQGRAGEGQVQGRPQGSCPAWPLGMLTQVGGWGQGRDDEAFPTFSLTLQESLDLILPPGHHTESHPVMWSQPCPQNMSLPLTLPASSQVVFASQVCYWHLPSAVGRSQ